jgi:hypothetical protein
MNWRTIRYRAFVDRLDPLTHRSSKDRTSSYIKHKVSPLSHGPPHDVVHNCEVRLLVPTLRGGMHTGVSTSTYCRPAIYVSAMCSSSVCVPTQSMGTRYIFRLRWWGFRRSVPMGRDLKWRYLFCYKSRPIGTLLRLQQRRHGTIQCR